MTIFHIDDEVISMIRMLTAHTFEVDDAAIALDDIMKQLDWPNQALAQTAAFFTCSFDFIESGILSDVAAALPFDICGCTTLTNATGSEAGEMMLALTVLTSDTCHFASVMTESLANDLDAPIEAAYQRIRDVLPEEPKLILAFAPLIRHIGGELILNALDRACKGVPIFGTIACDHDTSEYSHTFTLYGGDSSRDAMALLAISGDIEPRFLVTAISEDNIQKQKAIITESDGSVLMKVNDIPTIEYLKTLGLSQGNGVEGMSSIPFIVNYNDGTQPVARAIYMLTEEGYAVCGGAMPVNATLSVGAMNYEDILVTAQASIREALDTGKRNGLILFPCLGRNMVLGAHNMAEIDAIQALIGDSLPYHLSYSGGEICPVYDESGKTFNRFHNFSFIACIF